MASADYTATSPELATEGTGRPLLPGVVRESLGFLREGSRQRQWMGGGRFTIACWVTSSKSLDLSEPTFSVQQRQSRERLVLQGWSKWTVLDAIDMWTKSMKRPGVKGVMVLDGRYTCLHICVY